MCSMIPSFKTSTAQHWTSTLTTMMVLERFNTFYHLSAGSPLPAYDKLVNLSCPIVKILFLYFTQVYPANCSALFKGTGRELT